MYKSKSFTFNTDNICLYVNGSGTSNFTLYYQTEKGETATLYSRYVTGNFEFNYSFDPVSLNVYKDAKTFYFELTDDAVLHNFRFFEPKKERESEYDYSAITSDGNVRVSTISGGEIITPILPEKVVFIGNSILLGMENKYGMCSTNPSNDYANTLISKIREKAFYCQFEKVHGANFELATSTLDFENWFFNDKNSATGKPVSHSLTLDTNVVIIQLMDNINTPEKVEAFKLNAPNLIKQIKLFSPHARIIWVYGWFYKSDVAKIIINLCKKWKLEAINISSLHTEANEAFNQSNYVNELGNPVEVREAWFTHPGDKGMLEIANEIYNKLFN